MQTVVRLFPGILLELAGMGGLMLAANSETPFACFGGLGGVCRSLSEDSGSDSEYVAKAAASVAKTITC
jgi:hypothetical protein